MTGRPDAGQGRRPHVVIIGGGFGGLFAAQALRRTPVDITLIDRRNHHLFQPLLYQVATAALNPSDIASPIRSVLRDQRNASVLLAEVTGIDTDKRSVALREGGAVAYDYLVVATGVTHAYFGNEEWAQHAPGLKTIEDALEIRRRMLVAYEHAEHEPDPARRDAWLTFCVVGAGPTGAEMAGALAEIARKTLVRDFRRIDPRAARVILVEAQDRVLPPFAKELSEAAKRQLERLGVELRLSARVTAIDDEGLDLGGERIASRTVVWAAGVQASPLGAALGAPLDRAGRVEVRDTLQLPGRDEVFVVGDLARITADGRAIPGVAPAAIQGGRHAAASIARMVRGEPAEPFRYKDKGSLATIGRAAAVADLGGRRFSGFVAWLLWLLVHVAFLIGFRNRAIVLMQWAWCYVTDHRGARLITGRGWSPLSRPSEPSREPPST